MVQAAGQTADVREPRAAVVRAAEAIASLRGRTHQLDTRELTSTVRDLLALMQLAEALVVECTTDALDRGAVRESTAADAKQWVARLAMGESLSDLLPDEVSAAVGPLVPVDPVAADGEARHEHVDPLTPDEAPHATPGIEPAHARRIAKVAEGCTQLRNDTVRQAVSTGEVSVACARVALDEVDKVMHAVTKIGRDEVLGYFMQLRSGAGSRDIRALTRWMVARFGDQDDVERAENRLADAERLRWIPLPNGLTRLEADLSPTSAARVRQAINALSAPSPGNTCCDDVFHRHVGEPTGVADERPAEKRALDALVMLVGLAAELIDGDGATMSSGSARITVTMDYLELAGRVCGALGRRRLAVVKSGGNVDRERVGGVGRTETGESITPRNVRQLACDAEIIPIVLGSDGRPLDVGRRQRLVKDELRAAVIQRDRCCTFPGCDRPPSWCQVHHVVPWEAGGETSLLNSALLCQAHHTTVHRQGLMADVTGTRVAWDLHPGRMPKRSRSA